MKLVAILSVQSALILGLDLYFDTRLSLWLLYFLPLLGSARTPSIRVTLSFGILIDLLIVLGGICKIGQVSWEEILVPRGLAVYALGLTAVFLIRGKQFGARATEAFAAAASQMRKQDELNSGDILQKSAQE